MAIKLSGPLSFDSDIVREFISDNAIPTDFRPHSLSEYYKLGEYVPEASPQNDNIPLDSSVNPSGLEEIKFSDFYGAVNRITVELASGNISGGSLNLYSLAQTLGGQTPINNEITTPMVFVITSGMNVYNTIYTGGNFANLIIEIESGARVWGRGANANSTNNNPAIWVSTSMGSLEIINDGWLAAGGAGGSSNSNQYTVPAPPGLTFVCSAGSTRTVYFTAGGGGGQGGGNGASTSASANFSYSASGGSGNQTGGSGSNGGGSSSGILRPSGATIDRITSSGSASGGSGSSGGGQGGGIGLITQNNAQATDGTLFGARGGGGGGSGQSPSNGGFGSSSGGTIDGQGANCWNLKAGNINGQGGRSWGNGGSKNTIHNTGNASSYTLTNNGTMY